MGPWSESRGGSRGRSEVATRRPVPERQDGVAMNGRQACGECGTARALPRDRRLDGASMLDPDTWGRPLRPHCICPPVSCRSCAGFSTTRRSRGSRGTLGSRRTPSTVTCAGSTRSWGDHPNPIGPPRARRVVGRGVAPERDSSPRFRRTPGAPLTAAGVSPVGCDAPPVGEGAPRNAVPVARVPSRPARKGIPQTGHPSLCLPQAGIAAVGETPTGELRPGFFAPGDRVAGNQKTR